MVLRRLTSLLFLPGRAMACPLVTLLDEKQIGSLEALQEGSKESATG
jgi:hypothetical protein